MANYSTHAFGIREIAQQDNPKEEACQSTPTPQAFSMMLNRIFPLGLAPIFPGYPLEGEDYRREFAASVLCVCVAIPGLVGESSCLCRHQGYIQVVCLKIIKVFDT